MWIFSSVNAVFNELRDVVLFISSLCYYLFIYKYLFLLKPALKITMQINGRNLQKKEA